MPELDLGLFAGLTASIDGLTGQMQAERQRKLQLAADVAYISVRATALLGSALPLAWCNSPKLGYNWAIQAIAVEGLGTSDYLNLFKGSSLGAVNGGYGRWTFTVTTAGTIAAWHPGRTGLVLRGQSQDSLIFGGSVAGTATVNADVIQVTDAQLPYFLL